MPAPLILASGSQIRTELLNRAGITHDVLPARIDEEAMIAAMLSEDGTPRDIADALAEAKALKVSAKRPDAHVIGSDQILSLNGRIFQKACDAEELKAQIHQLQGQIHQLWTACVLCHQGTPQWRVVGRVDLKMRPMAPNQIETYVNQHWSDIQYCVGGYRYEAEGIRLFSRVEGDYFHVLGLPLLELVDYLMIRGMIS